MQRKRKIAVVLFQLGGPDSLDAVEPFLFNLFMDPDIIDFPFASFAREPLARLIASRRVKKVKSHYAEIGGKSPILELTYRQARALQNALKKTVNAKVFVAMRYSRPYTEETIRELQKEKIDEMVLLPLYPQYSKTTSGSSLNEWNRKLSAAGLNHLPVKVIKEFHAHPLYIEAVVEKVHEALKRFSGVDPKEVFFLFSAHGVPVKVIEHGDPYKEQVEKTVQLVMERGKWKSPHQLCWQSKVGPAVWLKPYLHKAIPELASRGVKNLLIIPIAFVTEHIETLHELNIKAREQAERLGISHVEIMPALNDSPTFINALADLVLQAIQ